MTYGQAKKALAALGLSAGRSLVETSDYSPGVVIEPDVSAGTTVARGSTIGLLVAKAVTATTAPTTTEATDPAEPTDEPTDTYPTATDEATATATDDETDDGGILDGVG